MLFWSRFPQMGTFLCRAVHMGWKLLPWHKDIPNPLILILQWFKTQFGAPGTAKSTWLYATESKKPTPPFHEQNQKLAISMLWVCSRRNLQLNIFFSKAKNICFSPISMLRESKQRNPKQPHCWGATLPVWGAPLGVIWCGSVIWSGLYTAINPGELSAVDYPGWALWLDHPHVWPPTQGLPTYPPPVCVAPNAVAQNIFLRHIPFLTPVLFIFSCEFFLHEFLPCPQLTSPITPLHPDPRCFLKPHCLHIAHPSLSPPTF